MFPGARRGRGELNSSVSSTLDAVVPEHARGAGSACCCHHEVWPWRLGGDQWVAVCHHNACDQAQPRPRRRGRSRTRHCKTLDLRSKWPLHSHRCGWRDRSVPDGARGAVSKTVDGEHRIMDTIFQNSKIACTGSRILVV